MRSLLSGALLLVCPFLLAQPNSLYQAISYQAVARDANGDPLANQSIGLEFLITAGPGVVYQETQTTTTNDQGLFKVNIGEGTPGGYGPLEDYPWYHPANDMRLFVSADFTGGTNYQFLGEEIIRAVPVAATARMATALLDSAMVVDINGGIIEVDPAYDLRVNGSLTYLDGNEGAGKVLVSDVSGTASWQDPQQTVIYQVDNDPVSSYVKSPMYVMELSDSWPGGDSKAVPPSVLTDYCGDNDGCRITLLGWVDEAVTPYPYARSLFYTYNPVTGYMEESFGESSASGFQVTLNNGAVMSIGSFCRFNTSAVIGGVVQPPDTQMHLYKGTTPSVERCILRIED